MLIAKLFKRNILNNKVKNSIFTVYFMISSVSKFIFVKLKVFKLYLAIKINDRKFLNS